MPPPAKWSWSIGNVNATAAQTQTAYQAITSNGRTRDFSVIVWNDIIDKIIEQRQSWGDVAWSQIGVPLMTAYMAPGEQMTAAIFYSAVQNMPPIHPWAWEATLGRKEIRKGDTCFGAYFIYLTDGLNHWMDLSSVPFVVSMPLQSALDSNVLVRRALHVINSQNLVWGYSATVDTKAPRYIIVPIDMVADIRMNLPLFGTPHVEQHLYFHLWPTVETTLLETVPIIIDNPILLDTAIRATTLSMLSMVGEIDGQLDFGGTLCIPGLLDFLIDYQIALLSSVDLSAIAIKPIEALVSGRFTSEAWAREFDSAPFNASLNPELSISAIFTSPNMVEIQTLLNVLWSPRAIPGLLTLSDTEAALDPALNIDVSVNEGVNIPTESDINGNLDMAIAMHRDRFESSGANTGFELSASVTIDFAADDRSIQGNLSEQVDIDMDIDFANNKQHTGAVLPLQTAMTTDAELTNDVRHSAVAMSDTLSMSATMYVMPKYTNIGGTITGALVAEASVTDLADYRVELISADLSFAFGSQANMDVYDRRLGMSGNIGAAFSGSAEFDMLYDAYISGSIGSVSTISVDVDVWSTPHIVAAMSFTSTASMTIEAKRLVLASEIDNTLVSDLDNTLVENVEFR